MRRNSTALGMTALLATLANSPLAAQALPTTSDPALFAAQLTNGTMPIWLTKAGEAMSEADYAFKPTPEVRSFGQLLAHIADRDYQFCATAKGEKPPVMDIEKTKTTRAEIQKALAGALAYCNGVYAGMTEEAGRRVVQVGRTPMPALTVLLVRTHHSTLHYGNIVTYMRLRGKVPPSTPSSIPGN